VYSAARARTETKHTPCGDCPPQYIRVALALSLCGVHHPTSVIPQSQRLASGVIEHLWVSHSKVNVVGFSDPISPSSSTRTHTQTRVEKKRVFPSSLVAPWRPDDSLSVPRSFRTNLRRTLRRGKFALSTTVSDFARQRTIVSTPVIWIGLVRACSSTFVRVPHNSTIGRCSSFDCTGRRHHDRLCRLDAKPVAAGNL
jgi:hypothetical protein